MELGRRHAHAQTADIHETRARGGVSPGAVLTGVVVALGAMFLLSAIVGGVVASLGLAEETIGSDEAIQAGIGAGIALVVAQFLSYLWGGYTAGRMGRGAGVANGFLVPLVAIVLALIAGALVTALGAEANLNLPFTTNRLPVEENSAIEWGVGVGIASLVAMFLGGIIGGALGSRWHTKLERKTHEEHVEHSSKPVEQRSEPVEQRASSPVERPGGPDGSREVDIRERLTPETNTIREPDRTHVPDSEGTTTRRL